MEVIPLTLYAILLIVTFIAPLRWGMGAYLLLANVDFMSGEGGLGYLNLVRGIAVPLYFLFRLRHVNVNLWGRGSLTWLAFTGYVGIASAWSLFPFSALKLMGHLIGLWLIYCAFLKSAHADKLRPSIVPPVLVGSLAIAMCLWIFSPRIEDQDQRFTTFATAQGFAALLAAGYCFVLCGPGIKRATRIILLCLIGVAMVANGSRIWLLCIVIATALGLFAQKIENWVKIVAYLGFILVGTVAFTLAEPIFKAVAEFAPNNRVAAALAEYREGKNDSNGLGTYRFRQQVNETALWQLSKSGAGELLFGRGTCNAAMVTGSLFSTYAQFTDPNRMLHNEWLRCIYEWGLIGFCLWCLTLGSITVAALRAAQRRDGYCARALAVYLPGFALALSTENIIAGAGGATTIVFLLLLAFVSNAEAGRREARAQKVACVRHSIQSSSLGLRHQC